MEAKYECRRHPLGNLRLDKTFAEALIPLIRTQKLFNEVALYDGQPLDIDLDLFRLTGIDYTKGYMPRWYFYAFHANYDLSKPWLWAAPDERFKGRLVVGRTHGYLNVRLDYSFLNEFHPVFLGLPDEFNTFKRSCPQAQYHPTKDFLEIAQILQAAKLYVGNQSSVYAVAEGLKCPRVLEVCLFAPNVIPHGDNGYDVVNQNAFETVVRELMAKQVDNN